MFVLLIAEISMRWIHNWSVFEPQSQNHVSCDKYWWRNILYINSLYPMKDMVKLQRNLLYAYLNILTDIFVLILTLSNLYRLLFYN